MTGRSKFDELRYKTDRQLIQVANSELDLGIRDAHRALGLAEDWQCAERYYRTAERAYAKATRVLSLTDDIRDEELGRVATRLGRLREVLNALSAIGSRPATEERPSEREVAALARVLWKARGCPEGLPEEDWFRAEQVLKHSTCVGSFS